MINFSCIREKCDRGYFGPVGIDAMIYKDGERVALQPIVEINARQTMSLVALLFQQKRFPGKKVRLTYALGTTGVLPNKLNGIPFKRQLSYEIE